KTIKGLEPTNEETKNLPTEKELPKDDEKTKNLLPKNDKELPKDYSNDDSSDDFNEDSKKKNIRC
ncbi:4352_t:CDS:1, partial [Racocetra persica]